MTRTLYLVLIALAVLAFAVGGWVVDAARWTLRPFAGARPRRPRFAV